MGVDWVKVFRSQALERIDQECKTTSELAKAIGKSLGEHISADALFNAHKRHGERFNLRRSLTDYLAQWEEKPKRIKPDDVVFELHADRRKRLAAANRFIITSALNNCALNEPAWDAIRTYATENKAEIIVIPARYKNPTSRGECKALDRDAWWTPELVPYMVDERLQLHEHLMLMADIRVNASAAQPLSGLDAMARGSSAIFGHAQLAMKMVPTPHKALPQVLYTTSSVSQPNYSDTRAGARAEFHHGEGAVIVELDGPRFYIREAVIDEDGGFYDLDRYYNAKGVLPTGRIPALVTGDEHATFASASCKAATYGRTDSIVNTLQPHTIVRHDVFEGHSISHHSRKDAVQQIANHRSDGHLLEDELGLTAEHIDSTTPPDTENLIVASNHNDFLLRWMRDVCAPFDEPWNAKVWLDLWKQVEASIEHAPGGARCADPLKLWLAPRLQSDTRFLEPDSDERIAGIAIGMHGHLGLNGSRGSLMQFSRIGSKSVMGHVHTPGRNRGAMSVGTSSELRMGYNQGPSTWAHAHCAIYPNGKRQMIFVINGHYRLC